MQETTTVDDAVDRDSFVANEGRDRLTGTLVGQVQTKSPNIRKRGCLSDPICVSAGGDDYVFGARRSDASREFATDAPASADNHHGYGTLKAH